MYRLLGRDAEKRPLTDLELKLFSQAIYEHVTSEFEPREAQTLVTGRTNVGD